MCTVQGPALRLCMSRDATPTCICTCLRLHGVAMPTVYTVYPPLYPNFTMSKLGVEDILFVSSQSLTQYHTQGRGSVTHDTFVLCWNDISHEDISTLHKVQLCSGIIISNLTFSTKRINIMDRCMCYLSTISRHNCKFMVYSLSCT